MRWVSLRMKLAGVTQQNLGQLYGPYRNFQSNCWVNLRILGQPCGFYLRAPQRGARQPHARPRPPRAVAPAHPRALRRPPARKVLGWPKRCKLAHAFLWAYSYKRLKLAQLLGQLGVFLTCDPARNASTPFNTKRV